MGAGFSLGLLTIFTACSFVLLPSYLALFLNLDSDEKSSTIQTLNRAQLVSVSMAGGFMTVLFFLGILFTSASSFLGPFIPYISIAMGVVLLVLAIAMLRGYELTIKLPEIGGKKSTDGSLTGMYIFGVSYAVASLGCAPQLFFGLLSSSTTAGSSRLFSISTLGSFLSYGFGMGLSVTVVTLAVAFGKQSLISSFRSIIPKLNKISAVLLLFIGPYVIWYGIYNALIFQNSPKYRRYGGPVLQLERFNNSLSKWLDTSVSLGGLPGQPRYILFAIVFAIVNVGLIAAGYIQRKSSSEVDQTSDNDVMTPV